MTSRNQEQKIDHIDQKDSIDTHHHTGPSLTKLRAEFVKKDWSAEGTRTEAQEMEHMSKAANVIVVERARRDSNKEKRSNEDWWGKEHARTAYEEDAARERSAPRPILAAPTPAAPAAPRLAPTASTHDPTPITSQMRPSALPVAPTIAPTTRVFIPRTARPASGSSARDIDLSDPQRSAASSGVDGQLSLVDMLAQRNRERELGKAGRMPVAKLFKVVEKSDKPSVSDKPAADAAPAGAGGKLSFVSDTIVEAPTTLSADKQFAANASSWMDNSMKNRLAVPTRLPPSPEAAPSSAAEVKEMDKEPKFEVKIDKPEMVDAIKSIESLLPPASASKDAASLIKPSGRDQPHREMLEQWSSGTKSYPVHLPLPLPMPLTSASKTASREAASRDEMFPSMHTPPNSPAVLDAAPAPSSAPSSAMKKSEQPSVAPILANAPATKRPPLNAPGHTPTKASSWWNPATWAESTWFNSGRRASVPTFSSSQTNLQSIDASKIAAQLQRRGSADLGNGITPVPRHAPIQAVSPIHVPLSLRGLESSSVSGAGTSQKVRFAPIVAPAAPSQSQAKKAEFDREHEKMMAEQMVQIME